MYLCVCVCACVCVCVCVLLFIYKVVAKSSTSGLAFDARDYVSIMPSNIEYESLNEIIQWNKCSSYKTLD